MTQSDPTPPIELEHWVRRTLLGGLVASGMAMAVGLLLALGWHQDRPGGPPPAFRLLVRRALGGDGAALMELGLLALIATPVLRVAVLGLGWGLERDWRFAAVAAVVFGLLLAGALLGVG